MEVTENKNSVGLSKLAFLDDICIELRTDNIVRVGLIDDVVDGHLSYFRMFTVNTRRD